MYLPAMYHLAELNVTTQHSINDHSIVVSSYLDESNNIYPGNATNHNSKNSRNCKTA